MNEDVTNIKPAEDIPDANEAGVQRSLRLSIWEGASYSVMFGFGEIYYIPLLLAIGATNFQVGFLVAIMQLFLGFSQFIGLALLERIRVRKPVMVWGGVAHLGFIFLILLGILSGWITPVIFILLAGGYYAAVGATIPSWASLMGDLTAGGARGEYFGRRNAICHFVFFICMLTAGLILEIYDRLDAKLAGFAIIIAVAFFGRAGSTYLLTRFYEGTYQYLKEAYFSFFEFLRQSGKSNFTKFVFFMACMNLAFQIAVPYFIAYMLNDLQFRYWQFTIATSVMWVAIIITTRQWGLVADRYGNRIVLKATAITLVVIPLLWFVSRNFYFILFIQFLTGVAVAGWLLCTLNFMMDAVTATKRARCSAYMLFTNSMGIFTGAMIGALLSSRADEIITFAASRISVFSPLYLVFLVSSIVGCIVIIIFLPRFHEVRRVSDSNMKDILMMLINLRLFSGTRFRFLPGSNARKNPPMGN